MTKPTEKRGPFYWIDQKPYVSVTEVLKVLSKGDGLMYWFGKQVYLATIADPTISQADALKAPYSVRDKAASRGSAVHSIVEVYKAGTDFESFVGSVEEAYKPYATAFFNWVSEYQPTVHDHERRVKSEKYAYAGTLDMVATVRGTQGIIDVKTGKDIYDSYWLQLAAYRQALKEEGTKVDWVAVLLLQENGRYKYECDPDNDLFRQFYACKVLWDWQNQEDYDKLTAYAKRNGKQRVNGQAA